MLIFRRHIHKDMSQNHYNYLIKSEEFEHRIKVSNVLKNSGNKTNKLAFDKRKRNSGAEFAVTPNITRTTSWE